MENNKTGILLRSRPKFLSFIAVIVQANNIIYMDPKQVVKVPPPPPTAA